MCNKKKSSLNHGFVLILFGVLIGLFIKLFVFDILNVSGVSMEPNVKDKSSVIVGKLSFGLV